MWKTSCETKIKQKNDVAEAVLAYKLKPQKKPFPDFNIF
jgi:hypothetical protein